MANIIYSGSTPTIRMKPTNGMRVSDLGVPTIALYQDMVFIEYTGEAITVDSASNSISLTLTEEDTLSLLPNIPCTVQQMWLNEETGKIVRFPTHEVVIGDTIVASLQPSEEEEEIEG